MLPLFSLLVVASIFGTAADSLKELVKTAYFTVFYVSISKPNEIIQSMKGEITHYLDFNDRLDGYTFFKAKTSPEESYDLDESTGEDLKIIKKLSNTFATNIVKGLSEQKIYSALIKKGYTEAQVEAGLKNYRQKKSA